MISHGIKDADLVSTFILSINSDIIQYVGEYHLVHVSEHGAHVVGVGGGGEVEVALPRSRRLEHHEPLRRRAQFATLAFSFRQVLE